MKTFNRKLGGFTLIELLVVIAIIGLLASIVLVALGGARDRARDARIISSMGQLRSAAEVYLGNTGAYTTLCNNSEVTALGADMTAQGGRSYNCYAAATTYCARVQLNNNDWWCVDSQLRSQQYSSTPVCSNTTQRCQ